MKAKELRKTTWMRRRVQYDVTKAKDIKHRDEDTGEFEYSHTWVTIFPKTRSLTAKPLHLKATELIKKYKQVKK